MKFSWKVIVNYTFLFLVLLCLLLNPHTSFANEPEPDGFDHDKTREEGTEKDPGPKDPRQFRELKIYDGESERIAFLVNHGRFENGLYIWHRDLKGRRQGEEWGRADFLLRGTFLDLEPQKNFITGHNDVYGTAGAEHSYGDSGSIRHHYFVFQITEATGAEGTLNRLYLLRYAHSPSGGVGILDLTDIHSSIHSILPWSYQEGSFHYVSELNALVYSLKQLSGRKYKSAVTGVIYFDFKGGRIHTDLPYFYEAVFPGVFVSQEDLPQLVRPLPNKDVAIFHPENKGSLTFTGVPFLEGGGAEGAERKKVRYYNLSARHKEIVEFRTSGRQISEIVFTRQDVLERLPPISRLEIFPKIQEKVEQFGAAQDKKYLIFLCANKREKELVEARLQYVLFESRAFKGRIVNLDQMRLEIQELFHMIGVMGQTEPIAFVSSSDKAKGIFGKNSDTKGDFLGRYLERMEGPAPLRFMVVATREEVEGFSGSESRFKVSDAQVVDVELSIDDRVAIAKSQWKDSEALKDVAFEEAHLRSLLERADFLDEHMDPLERTYRIIDFIADSVSVSKVPVARLPYEELEKLCYQFFGLPNFEAQTSEFVVKLRNLEEGLGRRVFGQGDGLNTLSTAVRNYYASETTRKGVREFILIVGNPGVGKTYTADQLGDYLGKELFLINLRDMPKHKIFQELRRYYDHYYRSGAILVLDEIDKSVDGAIFTFLHTILEKGFFAEHDVSEASSSNWWLSRQPPKTYNISGALVLATGNFEATESYASLSPERKRAQLLADTAKSWSNQGRGSQAMKSILDRIPTIIYYPDLLNVHSYNIAAKKFVEIQAEHARRNHLYLFSISFWENFLKLNLGSAGSGRAAENAISQMIQTLVVNKRVDDRIARDKRAKEGRAAPEEKNAPPKVDGAPQEMYVMRLLPSGEIDLVSSEEKVRFRYEVLRMVWAHLRDSVYHLTVTELRKLPNGEDLVKHLLKFAESSEIMLDAKIVGIGETEKIEFAIVALPADDISGGDMDLRRRAIYERKEKLRKNLINFGNWILLHRADPEVAYPNSPYYEEKKAEIFDLFRRFAFYRGDNPPPLTELNVSETPEQRMRVLADCIDRWVVQSGILDKVVDAVIGTTRNLPIEDLINTRIYQPLVLKTTTLRTKADDARQRETGRATEDVVRAVRQQDPELIPVQKELSEIRSYLNERGGVRVLPTLTNANEVLGTINPHSMLFSQEATRARILYLEQGVNPFLLAEVIATQNAEKKHEREVWLVDDWPQSFPIMELLKKHADRFIILILNGEVPGNADLQKVVAVSLKENTVKPSTEDRGISVTEGESSIQKVVEGKAKYFKKNWNIEFKPQVTSLIVRVSISADLAALFMDALVRFHTDKNLATFRASGKPFLEINETTVVEFLGSSDAISLSIHRGDPKIHSQILASIERHYAKEVTEERFFGLTASAGSGSRGASFTTSKSKLKAFKHFMIALISKWGRAALASDDASCSRRAYLYPTGEISKELGGSVIATFRERDIFYHVIQGGGSPFVQDGEIFITLEILETILGKNIQCTKVAIGDALVELSLDNYKRAKLLGILYHENFHKEGISDENLVDQKTVLRLHKEMGREAAEAYISFLENHGPGFLRNCWWMLRGRSEHLDAISRGEGLRGFLFSVIQRDPSVIQRDPSVILSEAKDLSSFDRGLERGLRQTNLRVHSDAFRLRDSETLRRFRQPARVRK